MLYLLRYTLIGAPPLQPYKKLLLYKKPSYVAEYGIGDEVGQLQVASLGTRLHVYSRLHVAQCEVDVTNFSCRARTRLGCPCTMACGHHSSHWLLAPACKNYLVLSSVLLPSPG